jgi:hypothetical protein
VAPGASVRPRAYLRRVPDLSRCPVCESRLVQPLRWQERPEGRLQLDLRCPECFAMMRGLFAAEDVAALDADMQAARATISDSHAACVRENMGELADRLAHALALDLVGPDDFAPLSAA